ncbi:MULTISPECIES: GPW/gp25 family protein [unclassified Saccharicrinis]|uniref:GPW/gp25 family protein n=1 Tax=unclassified Saccharicrinis TaxID=2646859 RepID=UPI003D350D8A
MPINQSFLGSGWSFPPEFEKGNRSVKLLQGETDIESSLEILLSTRLGERIMVPDYGCNLDELIFKPLSLTVRTYVTDLIKSAILYHEPRIDVIKIDIDPTNELQGELLINIEYIVRTTNSRKNMVFPFYKEEGSETNV